MDLERAPSADSNDIMKRLKERDEAKGQFMSLAMDDETDASDSGLEIGELKLSVFTLPFRNV